ncbi:MAG: class I SAM-dependent methyltransferase [Gammaproteobacteria bacterium]|nr:class I SAM-dependent methyltransferase [Gammaproteobacteria bacterium]
MNAFSADWLSLREPYDHQSRDIATVERLVKIINGRETRIVDLGSGTGSNLRFLAPLLPGPQRWTLLEQDERLLALLHQLDLRTLQTHRHEAPIDATAQAMDIQADFERICLHTHTVVTASALLDLVSASWLDRLATRCADAEVRAAYFGLTFDGRMQWTPAHRADAEVRRAIHTHQQQDKGFGAALGTAASHHARDAFAARGFLTHSASADWVFQPRDSHIQSTLIADWADVFEEIHPNSRLRADEWRHYRLAQVAANRSHLTVGHRDLLFWLA